MNVETRGVTFIYTEDNQEIKDKFGKLELYRLQCKHILSHKTPQKDAWRGLQEHIEKESKAVGYEGVVWGYASGTVDNTLEIQALIKMQVDRTFNRPIKVVRTSDGAVWADNTHSTIAYILRNQLKDPRITLSQVPYYVIDFYNREVPMIASIDGSVIGSIPSIQYSISKAERIEKRVQAGVNRKMGHSWTIEQFMSTMILPEWIYYREFVRIIN